MNKEVRIQKLGDRIPSPLQKNNIPQRLNEHKNLLFLKVGGKGNFTF
jgi:hypothetical protein